MTTVVIVIDGMDYELTNTFIDEMPFLKTMTETGYLGKLQSVTPPDSIPAWHTIYTGLNPGEHGVFETVDYLEILDGGCKSETDTVKGHTFWDTLSSLGKKVCIVNPFMAYPAWPVNGVMVSGSFFESGDVSIYPPDRHELLENCPPLGGIVAYPTRRTLQSFVDATFELTTRQFSYFRKICLEVGAEFNFLGILTLDRLKHFLWRYTDQADPTYPGNNKYNEIIKDLYVLLDRELKSTLESFPPGTRLLLLSDHGHGRRCTKLFRVNEFLRRLGYVRAEPPHVFNKSYLLEKVKDISLRLTFNINMEELLLSIGKILPGMKNLKTAKHAIKENSSPANVPKFDGRNPYGGISINRDLVGGGYDHMVRDIIDKLLEFTDPQTGEKVVKWAKPRSELYYGKHVTKFPDIVFGMEESYGVDWTLYSDLVAVNPFHRRISGGHRMDGIFAASIDFGHAPSSVTEFYEFVQKIM